jgi:tetratricopeptide (TPR) repeat protein
VTSENPAARRGFLFGAGRDNRRFLHPGLIIVARRHLPAAVAGLIIAIAGCAPPEERAAEFVARAQELFDAGEYEKAKLEARNAAQLIPRNAEARYLLALIAEKDEELRAMLNHLQVAVDADPRMWKARVKLGNLYYFARAYDEAAKEAQAAVELAPEDADARVLHGRVLLQQGDREGALHEVDAALERNADHVQAIALKASILAREDPDAALALLDEAAERVPAEDAKSLREIKLVLIGVQRPEQLERELLAMMKAAPADANYQVRLANLYASRGRSDEAEKILRDLVAGGAEFSEDELDGRVALIQFLGTQRGPEAVEAALQGFIAEQPENQRLRLSLGQFYEENGRHEDAAAVFRQVVEMDAKSEHGLRARSRLAAERMRAGDLEAAAKLIEGVLADAPDDEEAQLMRAAMAFTDGQFDDGVAALRVVLRREPDNERALLLLARTHAQAGETTLAKEAYRRLLEVAPKNADAAREFVGLSVRAGTLGEAAETLRSLAAANPNDAQIGALLTEVLVLNGDLEGAETAARQLVSGQDPAGVGAYQLGQVLEEQKRYPEAAKSYGQALDKNPDDLLALQGLLRTFAAQGKQDQAIAELNTRMKARPDAVNVRLVLASALGGKGRVKEAVALLDPLITARPELPASYLVLGSLYPEDPEARIAAYRRGLKAVPGNSDLGFALGTELQGLGRTDEAIALYEQLLAADPDLEWAINDLASTLLDTRPDDPAAAQRALQLVRSIEQTNEPMFLDTIGWAYQRTGNSEKAIRYLERAAAGADLPIVHYHLGMAYLAAGDAARARLSLQASLASGDETFRESEAARRALREAQGASPN